MTRLVGVNSFAAVVMVMADDFAEQTFSLLIEFHFSGILALAGTTVTVTIVTAVAVTVVSPGGVVASGEVASVSTISPRLVWVVARAAVVTSVVVVALLDLTDEFSIQCFQGLFLDAMNYSTITVWFLGQALEF